MSVWWILKCRECGHEEPMPEVFMECAFCGKVGPCALCRCGCGRGTCRACLQPDSEMAKLARAQGLHEYGLAAVMKKEEQSL